MDEITVKELKKKRDKRELFLLLDVREHFEYHISNLNGTLIPIDELPDKLEELEDRKEDEVVVMCRTGNRSATAQKLLLKHGFKNVKNLKGGINQWAREIDDSMPVY